MTIRRQSQQDRVDVCRDGELGADHGADDGRGDDGECGKWRWRDSPSWLRQRGWPWGRKTGTRAVAAVADVYLGFAAAPPALYEAMFQLPIEARFAQDDAEDELRSPFGALTAALSDADDGTATEVL